MDLAGADLKDWRFDGPPLNLSRVRLTGSRLMNARFRRVDLSGADLTGAELTRAELWVGSARNACLRDADLTGTRFRGLDLTGADLRAGRCYRTQLLACTLDRTLGPDTEGILIANCRLDRHLPPPQPQAPAVGTLARVLEGHQGSVLACGWSPDGGRLVSAGNNGTLRLWDTASGECLAILEDHQGPVLACGWSPDGDRLVSAGDDGTLRLWDAATGEPITIIHMFEDREYAILEPDGSGFRSASPGAWRWLGWQTKDPTTGRLERLPAETFGPIPGMT